MKGTNHLIQPSLVFWEPLKLVLIFDYEAAPLSRVDINPATPFARVLCITIFSLTTFEVRLFMVLIMLMESKVTGERLQKCQGVTGIDRWLEKIENNRGRTNNRQYVDFSKLCFNTKKKTNRRWIDTCTYQSSISGELPPVGCWAGWKEKQTSIFPFSFFLWNISNCLLQKHFYIFIFQGNFRRMGMYSLVMANSVYSLWAWFMMLHI